MKKLSVVLQKNAIKIIHTGTHVTTTDTINTGDNLDFCFFILFRKFSTYSTKAFHRNDMLFESFRTINGECNNINHPSWGSSTSAFTRLLDQEYADGKDIPRGGWLSAVEPGNTGKRTNNKQCKGYSKKLIPLSYLQDIRQKEITLR